MRGKKHFFSIQKPIKKVTEETYTISSIIPNIQGDKIAVTVAANGSENPETLIFKENGEKFTEILHLS